MARIAGVNIPTNKRVLIALTYIHGIGRSKAQEIVSKLSIPEERRVNQLSDDEVMKIRELIDQDYQVEGDLRRQVAMNIKRLMDLGCYRGLRHRRVPYGPRQRINAKNNADHGNLGGQNDFVHFFPELRPKYSEWKSVIALRGAGHVQPGAFRQKVMQPDAHRCQCQA